MGAVDAVFFFLGATPKEIILFADAGLVGLSNWKISAKVVANAMREPSVCPLAFKIIGVVNEPYKNNT